MAQLEIYPEEEIRVVYANNVANDDYESLFGTTTAGGRKREIETGFKNTALLSSSVPQLHPQQQQQQGSLQQEHTARSQSLDAAALSGSASPPSAVF